MLELESNLVGIDRLPQGLQGENTRRWLTLYLARLDTMQSLVSTFLDGLLTWDQLGAEIPTYTLTLIGRLLGQPWADGLSAEQYKRALIVRRIVRLSQGTAPHIRQVVAALGDLGSGASVYFATPHTVIVTFQNFATIDLPIAVVASLLIDAVGDVDRLQIWDAVGNVFTWDVENKGWLQAVWANPLFDSED